MKLLYATIIIIHLLMFSAYAVSLYFKCFDKEDYFDEKYLICLKFSRFIGG